MLKNKKILVISAIVLIIVFIGIVLFFTNEVTYDLIYSKNTRVTLYIEAEFSDNEIRDISEEVLGRQRMYIQRNSGNENIVAMTVKEISDEQIDSILQKINEKYELELSRDLHTYTIENGNARGRDIILPYAFQIIVVTAVVTMYFCIMYKKVGVMKVLGITLGVLAISQLLYLSIIAIIRIPINIFTMPLSLLIFAITIVGIAIILEKLKGSK